VGLNLPSEIPPRVLITGTTSGLGLALLSIYVRAGSEVIAVNRRGDDSLKAQFPAVRFEVLDITSREGVSDLLNELHQQDKVPDIFILNAGINKMDFENDLNLEVFNEVMQTNLYGVLTFVESIQKLSLKNRKLVVISSTSTLVPNSKSLGYYASKLVLDRMFRLFAKTDKENCYQIVVLGPVETNLNRTLSEQTGIQKKIFSFLSETSEGAALRCSKFIKTSALVLPPPISTRIFYLLLRVLLIFLPGFYYKPKLKTHSFAA
jgi:NAD(P)-dependent dehydrogenase (short-subunit alcohol dehydrogenase family)